MAVFMPANLRRTTRLRFSIRAHFALAALIDLLRGQAYLDVQAPGDCPFARKPGLVAHGERSANRE